MAVIDIDQFRRELILIANHYAAHAPTVSAWAMKLRDRLLAAVGSTCETGDDNIGHTVTLSELFAVNGLYGSAGWLSGDYATRLVADLPVNREPTPAVENCGYCCGQGWVTGKMYDRHGYKRHDTPPRLTCEYCGGSGRCVEGGKLLAAVTPREE